MFSEHPFVFAGLAGIVVVGGYAAYMYSCSRYGVSNTTRFNIGGTLLVPPASAFAMHASRCCAQAARLVVPSMVTTGRP